MPSRQGPKRTPTTNDPSPKAGSGSDVLAAIRAYEATTAATSRQRQAATPTEREEREARPRFTWENLVGIDGLLLMDVWDGTNETYGPYVGAVVRLPQPIPSGEFTGQTDAVVLTSASTTAGKKLSAKLDSGDFDLLNGEESEAIPVRAAAKRGSSKPTPDGKPRRPMIRLAFGKESA